MKQISQRKLTQLLRILKEDLPEDLRHYKETGEDGDFIDQDIDAIIAILEEAETVSPIIHCRSCCHAFPNRRSSTGLSCEMWGVEFTCCDCKPDGYCYKAKPRNGSEMRFVPRDKDYLPERAGQTVRVTKALEATAGGNRFKIRFEKDGYLTDAYEDELEEA